MTWGFVAFCGPLGEGDIVAMQTEPDAVVEDDYSDEEIDVDELERRMWRDKMRLKRLKEQSKAKEGIDAAKQRQSQEQARRKKTEEQSQEQARRKKIEEQSHARLRLRKELMLQSKRKPRNKPGGKRMRSNPIKQCLDH